MLIFERWFEEKHDVEFNEEVLKEFGEDYIREQIAIYQEYRKDYPLEKDFVASWNFLTVHPIFRGAFQDCIEILPQIDENGEQSVLIETYLFLEDDEEEEDWKQSYAASFDAWENTFELAIQTLAALIATEFGDYPSREEMLAQFELKFGKEKAEEELQKMEKELHTKFI